MTKDFAELAMTEAKVDDKMRVAIPASYYKVLEEFFEENEEIKVYLTISSDGCIVGYPPSVWTEYRHHLEADARANRSDRKKEKLKRRVIGAASPLNPDGQKRVLIPAPLGKYGAIQKKTTVTFVGQSDHFEIWENDRCMEFLSDDEED